MTTSAPAQGRARAPREFFGKLFDAVLDEIEQNPEFAEKLAESLGEHVTVLVKQKKRPVRMPDELASLDAPAALEEVGQIELRERLGNYRNAELAAYVRSKGLTSTPVSKMNKAQLVNVIIRSARDG